MKKLLLLLVTILLFVNYAMSQDTTAVCGNVANLNVDVTGYSDFTWFAEESDNTVGVFENANSPATTYTAVSYGNVKFYYDATIGGNIVSDTLYIIFYAVPEPTTTDGIDIVCGHMAELQVNTNPANDGRWVAYDMNYNILPTVVYQDYDDPQSASSNSYPHCYVTVPIPDDVTQVEYIFRWTETVTDSRLTDNCAGEVEKHVVFKKVPVLSVHQCGSTGNSSSVCDLNTVELCAETLVSDGFTDYIWTCNDIEGSFSDPTSNNTTFTPNPDVQITRFLDVDFLFSATNATGCTSTDTMHVRFLQKPTANAGANAATCGNSYELNGAWSILPSDDYSPTCQWIVYSKPNAYAQVTWYNTPHDSIMETIQVSDYGVYSFILREVNTVGDDATCFDRDTVTIEFMERPYAYAGSDFISCGHDFLMNATLSNADNISGTWSCLGSGTATFSDNTDPHTTGSYSEYGNATFRWTVSNHPSIEIENEATCSSSDDVVVTFYEMPSAVLNMNEDDTIVCGPTFENLRAEEINGSGGYWYDENQSSTFGSANNPESNVTVTNYGRHDFYWIEYDGPNNMCMDTAGPWTINFIESPTAHISDENITFCGMEGQLHADFNGVGEGRWSTNAAGISIEDRTSPNTTVYQTIFGDNEYHELYWNVQNTEFCTDTDTVRVLFARIPSDSIVVIPPKCFGEAAILTAYEDSLAIYDWEFGNGFIDSIAINSEWGEYRVFISWYDNEQTHVVGLTATNSWGCQSNMGSATITEPDLPEYQYNIIQDTCALGKGGIEFLDNTGLFSFYWIDTTVGPTVTDPITGYALTDNHVYNLPAGIYVYRTVYQTFNSEYISSYQQYFNDIYCRDYPMVEIGTTGMINAEFSVLNPYGLEAPEANVYFVNNTNYDNIDSSCEWYFGDGTTDFNCDQYVAHTYTEHGCYEPYLVIYNGGIPECRDTAYYDNCIFVDLCTIYETIDTVVDNYIQLQGHTFYTSGSYSYEVESDDTCRKILNINYVVRNEISDFESNSIKIYPNPASNVVHVVSPNPILKIEIVSVYGQSIDNVAANSCDVEYDFSGFVQGTYFVRIYDVEGNIRHKKIVKE